MRCLVRRAEEADAGRISEIVVAALRETNAKDYPLDIIERIVRNFGPDAVLDLIRRRHVLVAEEARIVVGTASLDGGFVRTVFVAPLEQGRGVGRALMTEIVRIAGEIGHDRLAVRSSITAEPFYRKIGFEALRDEFHEDERTIVMERPLTGSSRRVP